LGGLFSHARRVRLGAHPPTLAHRPHRLASSIPPSPPQAGESEESLPPLERLLRCEHEGAHLAIADALWEAPSDADALAALARLASGGGALAAWEAESREGRGRATGSSGAGGGGGGGRGGGRGSDDEGQG
jgi:uncharacterized membrane protein YgcG